MRIVRSWEIPPDGQEYALVLGNFDGVHIGHRALLEDMKTRAAARGLIPGVWSFEQHTRLVLAGIAPPLLTTFDERTAQLEHCGMEVLALPEFTAQVAAMTPEAFVDALLRPGIIRLLAVGLDYRFGCGRAGDVNGLRRLAARFGCEVHALPPVKINGQLVSSSAIRQALEAGDLQKAGAFLGRRYSVQGMVEHGRQLGRGLGMPTANLALDPSKLLPRQGVYATRVRVDDEQYAAVTNIGRNPTVGENLPVTVESLLLDFDGDLYGRELEVEFGFFLRDVVRFSSFQELSEQVDRDVERARGIWNME